MRKKRKTRIKRRGIVSSFLLLQSWSELTFSQYSILLVRQRNMSFLSSWNTEANASKLRVNLSFSLHMMSVFLLNRICHIGMYIFFQLLGKEVVDKCVTAVEIVQNVRPMLNSVMFYKILKQTPFSVKISSRLYCNY